MLMLWRYHWGQGLRLEHPEAGQIAEARRAIAAFEQVHYEEAQTTGGRLQVQLDDGFLEEYVVFSLSAWCNTWGRFEDGVLPARQVSKMLFNDKILPRLRGKDRRGRELRVHEARGCLRDFLKDAAALAE